MAEEFKNDFSSFRMGEPIDLSQFEKDLQISVREQTEDKMVIQLTGVDASLMNALRRTMMDDVPTMAIDRAVMYQNTSVICDEVLVHRLGLVPIKADPELFQFKEENEAFTSLNSVKFNLHVKCTNENNNETKYGIEGQNNILNVYASDLVLDSEFHKDSEIHLNIR